MQLKRLWDTEGKKIVFAEGPSGHMCQVRTDVSGDHLYIYDMAQWLSYNGTSPAGMEYDRSNWVELVDQEVGFYDTNEPTDLYSWDSGDKASYKFVDWDGTVLKSGVVEEGETPTAPADPTRAATAQYTYTFAGWNPTVGPISKKATFTATYTATVNQYTVTIQSNNTDWGTVDESTVTVDYGTAISAEDNVLTIGTTEVTATAGQNAEFTSWTVDGGALPATVTETLTITATFQAEGYTLTFTAWDNTNNQEGGGTVSPTTAQAPIGALLFVNDSDSADAQIRTGNPDEDPDAQLLVSITETEDTGYYNDGWYVYNESTQEWDYHYAAFLPITGNMQVRNYFIIQNP